MSHSGTIHIRANFHAIKPLAPEMRETPPSPSSPSTVDENCETGTNHPEIYDLRPIAHSQFHSRIASDRTPRAIGRGNDGGSNPVVRVELME